MGPLQSTSSIGAFGVEVTTALRRAGAEVDVWGAFAPEVLEYGEPPRLFSESPQVEGVYDHVVYNMGNNPVYHTEVFEAYRRRPGIVIMHDKAMLEFFMSLAASGSGWDADEAARFTARLAHLYGPDGLAFADVLRDPSLRAGALVNGEHAFPLFEPCLSNAYGLVTHSRSALGRMRERYGALLPSTCLDLPLIFDARHRDPGALMDRDELGLGAEDLVITIHGYVTGVKRVHSVLEAIAADEDLSRRALLVVAGEGEPGYVEELRRLSSRLGLAERVRITGRVDDRSLFSHVAAADICVNLRMPSTEAASASLGEQLHFGRPTVVSDVGSFSELPDDVVMKIDMADEVGAIRETLRRLAGEPELRAALGARGKAYAEERFSADTYAAGLLALLDEVTAARDLLRLVDEAADRIGRDFAPDRVREAAARTAAEFVASLGPPEVVGAAASPEG